MIDAFFDAAFQATADLITFWPTVILFVSLGIFSLNYGADWLVNGASNIGFRFGMNPVMIGLTLVAFGTSSPELVVSALASSQGQPELSLGNVIGSNIANTTLILGLTAMICPLAIKPDSIKFDAPISLAAIVLAALLAWIGYTLGFIDGLILLLVFFLWMAWLIRKARRENRNSGVNHEDEPHFVKRASWMDWGLVLIGLILLMTGAKTLVVGAVETAYRLHVSEVVVGLTIVAGGTSLPELAVCMVAALRKRAEITVGNVLGSNIFNALLILGTAASIHPIAFKVMANDFAGDAGTLMIDFPFCILVCFLIIPLMRHKNTLGRGKGLFLLLLYVLYLMILGLRQI